MKRNIWLWICSVLFVFLLAFGSPSHFGTAQSSAKNVSILFIFDDSGSMAGNDPRFLRYTAARMVVSALDVGDSVGLIKFSTTSNLVTPSLVKIQSEAMKSELFSLFKGDGAEGYTDFLAALKDAQTLLSTSTDETERIIVFLTDGQPMPLNRPSNYEQLVLDSVNTLDVPIFGVALTPQGESALLSKMVKESNGVLIPAQDSSRLIDVFLQILGQLKDRTVLKGDRGGGDLRSVSLDPALAPYITKATFIAVHKPGTDVQLISPTGDAIGPSDPSLLYASQGEDTFSAFTIEQPAPGVWSVNGDGAINAELSAILYSRLRLALINPVGFVSSGQPVCFQATVLEEMEDGTTKRVVGNVDIHSEVTLPDGTIQSLDRFYDDGSHCDTLSGDGIYSRAFVSTEKGGEYSYKVFGRKDLIPLSTIGAFTSVEVPVPVLSSPGTEKIYWRDEAIPITISFSADSQMDELFEGSLSVDVALPSGQMMTLGLTRIANEFVAAFQPTESGDYRVTLLTEDGYYRGIQLASISAVSFAVERIATLEVKDSFIGLNKSETTASFSADELKTQSIPVTIVINSPSDRVEKVALNLDLPGFKIDGENEFELQPGSDNKLLVWLAPTGSLEAGNWEGNLTISPLTNADFPANTVPISFEIFQPNIVLEVISVESRCQKVFCFFLEPIRVTIKAVSTVPQEQRVFFAVNDLPGSGVKESAKYIQKGSSTFVIEVTGVSSLKPGAYDAELLFTPENETTKISNSQLGNVLRFSFTSPRFWDRCKKHVMWFGLALIASIIILRIVMGAIRKRRREPLVKGTFVYWPVDKPYDQTSFFLSDLKKKSVIIGSGADADVVLNELGVQQAHLTVEAQKSEDGDLIVLRPKALVLNGYFEIKNGDLLDYQTTYRIGNIECRFIKDEYSDS